MGKKNHGHSAAKKGSSAVPKPVCSQPLLAESSTPQSKSGLNEFWDDLCKENPVRDLNNHEIQLDSSSSFSALPFSSAPAAVSKSGPAKQPLNSPSISETLGKFDTELEGPLEKNCPMDKGSVVPHDVQESGTEKRPDMQKSGTEKQPDVQKSGTEKQPDVQKSGTENEPVVAVPTPRAENQGRTSESEGDAAFVLVGRKHKFTASQKGKQQAKD
ncbi:hypothetical protein Fot_37740 [Forsythia ovata]|uniref:Uncharacterized protein n=1 Tax=Forsythia ovata TaxID=205694 RepID=A0ABD1RZU5_9LAMI